MTPARTLGWGGILRLGLAQLALGAIAVLATSTLNRVMVVELGLPAIVPGALVGLHYALQVLRPRLGFASDRSGQRSVWIIAGIAMMAAGNVVAACAVAVMRQHGLAGIAVAVVGYASVGVGVGAAGTALLTLLAERVAPARRPGAAAIVWLMMIAGFVISAGVAGAVLTPFSYARLIEVVAGTGIAAVALTALALWGIEVDGTGPQAEIKLSLAPAAAPRFAAVLRDVWSDRASRRFGLFVFISMLAYGGQELLLEPFAALVFHLSPGGTARIAGLQHSGELFGMLLVAIAGMATRHKPDAMRNWTLGGCLGSSVALLALATAGFAQPDLPLRPLVVGLGVANGCFAVSAIGAMMQLASRDASQAGTRMGLFGAAQAIAFAGGGLVSSGASDIARHLLGTPLAAYACVFAAEAVLFLVAARLAGIIFAPPPASGFTATQPIGSYP